MGSPTSRTLDKLRADGYVCAVVEKYNTFSRMRNDLFGFADIIAFRPNDPTIILIQATSGSNVSARRHKLSEVPAVPKWLSTGHKVQIWGWAKKGARGARKLWTPTIEDFLIPA